MGIIINVVQDVTNDDKCMQILQMQDVACNQTNHLGERSANHLGIASVTCPKVNKLKHFTLGIR